ncbi:MAG: hypothetical protein RBS36_09115 [Thiomicrospira sp.]|jgi:hypothetical protein|nr:hypothetical protein [Thiomicrospira sp.]
MRSLGRTVLAQKLFWDSEQQVLWLDARKVLPKVGVLALPSWDRMMLSAEPIPAYPPSLDILHWSVHSDLRFWLQQIPSWVVESCRLFPSHQLTLLHYAGRYPQMLELLDHSPMLAWQLVKAPLTEAQRVALFMGKRTEMVAQLGWPGKVETVKFLRNLRLRAVNADLLQQVEVCLLDEKRLDALQTLPRINSMALSLAARFPELIGRRLHQTLARLPCRPMQCQAMIALLEDVYRLAEAIGDQDVTQKIGECRYLVEVEQLYQAWLHDLCAPFEAPGLVLTEQPRQLSTEAEWRALAVMQNQAWWLDYGLANVELWAWMFEQQVVGALIQKQDGRKLMRLRQENNQLASVSLQTQVELWLASKEGFKN